ncbi:MAG: hypothetical protein PUB46_01555 [Lachnospiraceae bacterium]|uniref:hypothetical protein n=1 Tax=Roseburia hominis TaxID=301301 RepID=UPI001F2C6361|nr:hypothetical protein [Roseburia hominis]MCI5712850.1 hypothetical protein [Lachnospiraceae bacterium]MDD6168750.1 hypothetical protein [Lachnospiraceae bacterium]MDY4840299.1 hypothetical protein [Lachnospiraceae bacterium]
MKDLIEERNRREEMQNSIIKWWNVNLVPYSEEEAAFAKLSVSEKKTAKDIIARLDKEAAEDEAIKAKEVEAAKVEREEMENTYNAATNSYSGAYGMKPVEDEEEKSRIEKILHEKEDAFQKELENTKADVK